MSVERRTKGRTKARRAIPCSDLLIIECDSQELARTALNLGTWFGRIASVAFSRRRIALVQTSTAANLKDDLDAAFTKHGRFRSLLIVGHSDENGLVMVSNAVVPWADVGKLIRRFQPERLFLCACRAGHSKAVRSVFENAKSLREIYGSPVDLLKIHTAPMGVLIGIELHGGKVNQEESAGIRIASFIHWGVQTYCWRRDEMGPGNELEVKSWDAVAKLLGVTNWDLSDAITDWVKKIWPH
jgi:hypothetical protein